MNFVPIDMLPTQYSLFLLPEQGKYTEVYFTSENSLMDLRCAAQMKLTREV